MCLSITIRSGHRRVSYVILFLALASTACFNFFRLSTLDISLLYWAGCLKFSIQGRLTAVQHHASRHREAFPFLRGRPSRDSNSCTIICILHSTFLYLVASYLTVSLYCKNTSPPSLLVINGFVAPPYIIPCASATQSSFQLESAHDYSLLLIYRNNADVFNLLLQSCFT